MYFHERIGDLDKYLQDIESRIDATEEERIYSDWKNFADGQICEGISKIEPRKAKVSKIKWPNICVNDAIKDETLMLYSVYKACSALLSNGHSKLMSVRPNYGVGILPNALANVEFFPMTDEQNILPNVRPMKNGVEDVKKIVAEDLPSVYQNIGVHVFSIGTKFMEIKAKYPKIGKYILFDHPDTQGPMDVADLLWGSDIFFELYESPELVHAFLQKITDYYIKFLDEWFRIVPNNSGYHVVFGKLIKGKVLIRNDSAVNVSPDFFYEFIKPYDEQILEHFNGGAIHFCGRGDHFIPIFKEYKFLTGVDLSQPHLNDMKLAFEEIIDKDLKLFSINRQGILNSLMTSDHKLYNFALRN
ncbi:hypothetical protein AN643_01810 [Candidatus Epulonipiscioides saccharophilum]|nr:hypothetical protein AN643_01810 [Epulopiscium sp. SCG-B10WGA-EpuloB]